MPASPIKKKIILPDNWVHLQKTMIPDSNVACYFSVWYDVDHKESEWRDNWKGTAWLMWCPIDDAPSVNDSWGHAEEIDDSCRNVLNVIESVFGVSFHESIWVEITPEQALKSNPLV